MMQKAVMNSVRKEASPGITIRLPDEVRQAVSRIARQEHRSTAAYIQSLVELDLRHREEAERVVRIHVSADAPDWGGTVERGEDESETEHAERTAILQQLFGVPGRA